MGEPLVPPADLPATSSDAIAQISQRVHQWAGGDHAANGTYRYQYRGIWRPGATCGIAVFVPEAGDQDRRPLILCTELSDNPGTSITNLAEVLAAEIIARHFPALLDAPAEPRQPVRWVENVPGRARLAGGV